MAAARFQQIAELYHAVREGTPAQRAALLDAADPDLRREVESLLAQPTEGEFLARSAMPDALALLRPEHRILAAGTRLGPYRIEHRLGKGGMGDVYRATDTRLGRAVAIKVARGRFTAAFRSEARAIAALNHPHICALHDIGPDYMVMELIEGETLAARLRQGALPRPLALTCARQILSALAQAHAKGIVHRDLKPANLMLTPTGVKVLDFGLAQSVADATRTLPAHAMGTPAYVSPEQRAGQSADPRSDLWSFGCVLHEMLTGDPPGRRDTRIAPRTLEHAVARCVETDPARRWPSAAELEQQLAAIAAGADGRAAVPAALRTLAASRRARAVAAACALAAMLAAAFWLLRPAHAPAPRGALVLADFVNRTRDPVFDGTLRQALAVQLEESPFLGIVADARVRQALGLMDRKPDAALTPEVALDLCQRVGGTAVIEGSIAQVGAPYQLAIRAVDCANGETLAGTLADAADKSHVLGALDAAASRLRVKLGESLRSVRRFNTPLEQATTSSLDALKAYSEGMRNLWSDPDPTAAIPLFKRAIELDPDFALAYGTLTVEYTNLGESRIAADYARKAYALRAHVSEPERYFITARYGRSGNGDIDMAIKACLAWIEAYPDAPMPRIMLAGSIYPVIGEFEQGAAQGRASIRLMPTNPIPYALLMDDYIALGRVADARAVFDDARRLRLHSTFFLLDLYELAFLRNDAAGMAAQLAAAKGQAGTEDLLLAAAAGTAAYRGQLRQARQLSGQATNAAQRAGAQEPAATYLAMSALREALAGNADDARRLADAALQRAPARDVVYAAALAFAFAGAAARAEALAGDLARDYPEDTLVQFNYLPALRAKLALARGRPADALALLAKAAPYEMAATRYGLLGWTSLYPNYVRGEAYLALHDARKAAAEFQAILDRRGIALNYPVGPMARLQRARALSNAGARAEARAAYAGLLDLWKDADADLPVLKQAKAEAARLD